MAAFQYTARTSEGKLITEVMDSSDEVALRRYLRANNLYVLEVTAHSARRFALRRRVGLASLIVFARHLRTMLDAGMPLLQALESLGGQSDSQRMGQILTQLARDVSVGRSLAEAMSEYPNEIPELLVTLVKAGEDGGRLSETLREASRQLEMQMEIRQKLLSAMIYPVFTLFATILTVTAMMLFIVPVFAKIYKELNAPLPIITKLLMSISDVFVHQGWMVALALTAAIVAFRRWAKTPEGRLRTDRWKLKVPVFGNLVRKASSANLTSSLGGLLESGVPLIQALQSASRVTGNEIIARAARSAAQNLALGRPLSSEFERSGEFPPMVTRLLSMAEQTGSMPEVLRQLAQGFNEDVEYAIRRVMTVIEPILVLSVGGVVGFVLVALYMPIFSLGNAFMAQGP